MHEKEDRRLWMVRFAMSGMTLTSRKRGGKLGLYKYREENSLRSGNCLCPRGRTTESFINKVKVYLLGPV